MSVEKVIGAIGTLAGVWLLCMCLYLVLGPSALIIPMALVASGVVVAVFVIVARGSREARAVRERDRDRNAWLALFPLPVHYALGRLAYGAPELWAPMGMGRAPRQVGTVLDPGAGPVLLHAQKTDLGVRVTLAMLDGHSLKHYQERRGQMSGALNVHEVRVVGVQGRQVTLELVVANPLDGLVVSDLIDNATADQIVRVVRSGLDEDEQAAALRAACARLQLTQLVDGPTCRDDIFCGPGEDGAPIVVNLAAGSHMAIQGRTRSGKSIFLNTLLAWASIMRDVRVVIIDPNTAAVAPWWRTAYQVYNGRDPQRATEILTQITAELVAREAEFWRMRTDRITSFSPEFPLYFVVIDEVSHFSRDNDFQAALSEFCAQGHKFGGRGALAGQKLGAESISTTTRSNLPDKFCFAVEKRETMAHLFENTPDLESRGLMATAEDMPQGVAIIRTRSHKVTGRMRAVYLPTEACWVISDAIVAHRGALRALPGQPALPPASDPAAITAKSIPIIQPPAALPAGSTPEPVEAKPARRRATLPPLPGKAKSDKEIHGNVEGNVVPFDRNTRPRPIVPNSSLDLPNPRTGRAEQPGQDTGTE